MARLRSIRLESEDGSKVLARVYLDRVPPVGEVTPDPTPAEQMQAAQWLRLHLHPRWSHERVRRHYFGDWEG